LIAADGCTDQKQFSTREAAIAWLDGDGVATFEGEVERAEIWAGSDLLMSKKPKTEDRLADPWFVSSIVRHTARKIVSNMSIVRKARKWSR